MPNVTVARTAPARRMPSQRPEGDILPDGLSAMMSHSLRVANGSILLGGYGHHKISGASHNP